MSENEISGVIIKTCIEIHSTLGPGCSNPFMKKSSIMSLFQWDILLNVKNR